MKEEPKFIDIKGVVKDKNPALLRWMPGFMLRYIQGILHEDAVNAFINLHQDKDPFEFCAAVMTYFNIQLSTVGLENVPQSGGCVLAINHPLGGMDAMAIVTLLEEKRKDIKFIVNDILMNLRNLNGLFVGVNKVGPNAKKSLREVDKLFATDQLICVFPAGLVSRKLGGKVVDLEWKKTFVTRSRKHNKPIIPVHIDGALTNFFYRLANIRKRVGIKANIEMLYLVNEMFKQQDKKMKVLFGAPIEPGSLGSDKSDMQWAAEIKKQVYQLADDYAR